MNDRVTINQYDLVEIIQVPENHEGVIEIGDIGVVLEKYSSRNFQIECIQPDGSSKWLAPLNIKYLRLRSKDPYHFWIKKALIDRPMMRKSVTAGSVVGAVSGALIGGGLGTTMGSLNGTLIGLVIGLILGAITGAPTAALTVRTAGTMGGIGVGYFTGMLFGGIFGMILGALIPTSWRMSANTQGVPVLDALMMGRFETAILVSFLLSILGTIVGTWIGGKNLLPRNLEKE